MYITLLEAGSEYSDTRLRGPYLNTNPISGIDLHGLRDGIIMLASDKVTQLGAFTSAAHAAFTLDSKVEFMYISRYINVEHLVSTTIGLVYFVMNPNYIVPTSIQFKGSTKGAKVPIYMFDPNCGVYVMFLSKAYASDFI